MGAARSRNPVETVVALLAVLGLRTAEVPTTKMLITSGLRAWRPANARRRRLPFPHAPDAAPLGNLAKAVVAVAEVLGSKPAEVLVTQNVSARGTRVSRPAKHDHSPRQQLVSN